MSNRICIPKDLIPHVLAEGEKLLLSNDLSKSVEWILRAYFRSQGVQEITQPIAQKKEVKEFVPDDLNDIFAA